MTKKLFPPLITALGFLIVWLGLAWLLGQPLSQALWPGLLLGLALGFGLHTLGRR